MIAAFLAQLVYRELLARFLTVSPVTLGRRFKPWQVQYFPAWETGLFVLVRARGLRLTGRVRVLGAIMYI